MTDEKWRWMTDCHGSRKLARRRDDGTYELRCWRCRWKHYHGRGHNYGQMRCRVCGGTGFEHVDADGRRVKP